MGLPGLAAVSRQPSKSLLITVVTSVIKGGVDLAWRRMIADIDHHLKADQQR